MDICVYTYKPYIYSYIYVCVRVCVIVIIIIPWSGHVRNMDKYHEMMIPWRWAMIFLGSQSPTANKSRCMTSVQGSLGKIEVGQSLHRANMFAT